MSAAAKSCGSCGVVGCLCPQLMRAEELEAEIETARRERDEAYEDSRRSLDRLARVLATTDDESESDSYHGVHDDAMRAAILASQGASPSPCGSFVSQQPGHMGASCVNCGFPSGYHTDTDAPDSSPEITLESWKFACAGWHERAEAAEAALEATRRERDVLLAAAPTPVKHFRRRAERAEGRLAEARQGLRQIAESYPWIPFEEGETITDWAPDCPDCEGRGYHIGHESACHDGRGCVCAGVQEPCGTCACTGFLGLPTNRMIARAFLSADEEKA